MIVSIIRDGVEPATESRGRGEEDGREVKAEKDDALRGSGQ